MEHRFGAAAAAQGAGITPESLPVLRSFLSHLLSRGIISELQAQAADCEVFQGLPRAGTVDAWGRKTAGTTYLGGAQPVGKAGCSSKGVQQEYAELEDGAADLAAGSEQEEAAAGAADERSGGAAAQAAAAIDMDSEDADAPLMLQQPLQRKRSRPATVSADDTGAEDCMGVAQSASAAAALPLRNLMLIGDMLEPRQHRDRDAAAEDSDSKRRKRVELTAKEDAEVKRPVVEAHPPLQQQQPQQQQQLQQPAVGTVAPSPLPCQQQQQHQHQQPGYPPVSFTMQPPVPQQQCLLPCVSGTALLTPQLLAEQHFMEQLRLRCAAPFSGIQAEHVVHVGPPRQAYRPHMAHVFGGTAVESALLLQQLATQLDPCLDPGDPLTQHRLQLTQRLQGLTWGYDEMVAAVQCPLPRSSVSDTAAGTGDSPPPSKGKRGGTKRTLSATARPMPQLNHFNNLGGLEGLWNWYTKPNADGVSIKQQEEERIGHTQAPAWRQGFSRQRWSEVKTLLDYIEEAAKKQDETTGRSVCRKLVARELEATRSVGLPTMHKQLSRSKKPAATAE
ncbi:hypothetical protein D9Q98_004425 [Chlorella vulgaris]|uniref:Uncharacterized protein n=1 Tax=Chlorella vulgaris TaxID=3077 RepID=A0A9D4TPL8_CHLVU|nr:hypothetical protein D9Q98_004425 [Chlorella vulgaris]